MTATFADFRKVGLNDRDQIRQYLFRYQSMSCEQNYCNMFNWSPEYRYHWLIADDRLLVRLDGEQVLMFPCGKFMPPEQLRRWSDLLREQGWSGEIYDVPPEYLAYYPDYRRYFTATSDADTWDYIYVTEKLYTLAGPKLRKKRNHLAHFEREFPHWLVLPLNDDTVGEFEQFVAGYYGDIRPEHLPEDDYTALENGLEFYAYTGLEGLALHNSDRVVAIALFSRQSDDTYTVHFEKFDRTIPGASQMINHQTAAHLRSRCRYLNREQDMGLPGLRRAKHSYDPEFMLQDYRLMPRD
ncbi:MAG: phosphatidylglycerol lysyltransferase domain-containing protein [Victivallales bacterium]|nr:phosphatidylglycerol lysyltransferase domain-containing protein [Victivallales bacterium]